ncbi:hypothetical protein CKO15_09245 [Halorhodospira abdelmalekii]|uniref:diguanylate cyclase domain-containing protein n=1 Tax=Halorhodospira abdelmalekii TaxID=421629 RepID=UPI001904532D|nr:diguanylate cyclase [Halorhodospira abdelmalekii]MBK1735464.1 hypothetical protein [Halorhodospira abdelmalekii]
MDLPTLFLIIALINLLLAVAMVAMVGRSGQRAMSLWALAALFNAGGYLCFMWHAHSGYPVLLLLGNIFLISWLTLLGEGLRRFYRRPFPRWLLWVPLPVVVLGLLPLLDDFQGRVILVTAVMAYQAALLLYIVARNRGYTPGRGQVIVVVSLLALLIVLGARLLFAASGGFSGVDSLLQRNIVQVLTFHGGLLVMILLALGLIVMVQERTVQSLAASERRFRALFEESLQPLTLMDARGVFTVVNDSALKLLRVRDQAQLVGRSFTAFTPPRQPDGRSSATHARAMFAQVLEQGGGEWEWSCLRGPDGELFDALLVLTAIDYEQRQLLHVAWSDITLRKAAERELRVNEEKFRTLVEDANDIIYTLNMGGVFEYVTPNIREILAHEPEDLVGRHFSSIVHPNDLPACQSFLQRLVETGDKQSGLEYRVRHQREGWHWHVSNASPLRDKEGSIIGMLGIAHDVTERKRNEDEITRMAHYDGLTELPNRALLFSRLRQALAEAQQQGKQLALLFVDLDRFKPINDIHGHAVGDQVLREAAQRLLRTVRASDTVSRIGGDEFIILLPGLQRGEHAIKVAENIRGALQKSFFINGLRLQVASSIGVACYPEHGQSGEELAHCADLAMYHAKESGSDQIRVYTPCTS